MQIPLPEFCHLHLGEQAFAAAWSQGQKMTPEQALAHVPFALLPARPSEDQRVEQQYMLST